MKRGRKRGSGRPWQEHFYKRLEFQGDHWIWLGRFNPGQGTAMFSAYLGDRRRPVSKSAASFAYWYKYGEKRKTNAPPMTRLCDEPRCINPDHRTNGSPDKLYPHEARDSEIKEIYRNYLKWREWNLEAIGKKYGMTRQRVQQIVGTKANRRTTTIIGKSDK